MHERVAEEEYTTQLSFFIFYFKSCHKCLAVLQTRLSGHRHNCNAKVCRQGRACKRAKEAPPFLSSHASPSSARPSAKRKMRRNVTVKNVDRTKVL